MKDVSLTIDGIAVTVPAGTLLVEAAKRVPVEVPVYCYHEKLGPAGLCRVCLVEIEGMPKLQIACNTFVADGMKVQTQNAKVDGGRRAILEFLLLNHPLDCPICDKGGECDLQDFVVAYGPESSRVVEGKVAKPKAVDLGPTIVLDEERCIVCQRCVRFDEIITGERSLVVKDRGVHDIIATATDTPYLSQFSGNVTELCPVGALTSKTYRFLSRKWDNHRAVGNCAQCAVGCGLNVDARDGKIARTMSIPSDVTSDGWLCDRGRYAIGFVDDRRRLRTPLLRQGDTFVQTTWDEALSRWAEALRRTASPERIAVLGGARLMNEENYLLQALFRRLGTPHLDWRTGRERQAAAGRSQGRLADLATAQAIVIAGVPPSQSAPVFDLHLRRAVSRGGAKLITAGPFGAGSSVPEKRVEGIDGARALLPEGVERVAIIWDGRDASVGRDLAALERELRGKGASVHAFVTGGNVNALGAESMGVHPFLLPEYESAPSPGLDIGQIFRAVLAGAIDVLSLHGANPVLTWQNGALARQAIEHVPFAVVTDLFLTESSRLADLVLPVASAFERDGHMTNLLGEVREIRAALPAPSGTLTDAQILIGLAGRLGLELPGDGEVSLRAARPPTGGRIADLSLGDERLIGPAAHSPRGREPFAEGALRIVFGTEIFAGGGTMAHDERIESLRPRPSVALSPETARRLGLASGESVDLIHAAGALRELRLRIEPALAADVLGLVDGIPEAPANTVVTDGEIRLESAEIPLEAAR
jgi:NADH-quinone oxidoreductase subunit G